MDDVLTVLVAGHRPDRLPAGEAESRLFQKLDKLLAMLRDVARGEQATLRVLTGVSEGTDKEAALIAERLGLPLHLLSPGQPEPLVPSQQRAERVVWLGASDEKLHGDEGPITIRDEMALCFAELLVIVWDGKSPKGLSGGTVRLAFQAAKMMKPVVWLKTDGTVYSLDRTSLDAPCLHRLGCPHPEPVWLQELFSSIPDEAVQRQKLSEEVRLVFDPSTAAKENDAMRLADYRAGARSLGKLVRAGHLHEAMTALVRADFGKLLKQLLKRLPEPYWGPVNKNYPTVPTPLIDGRFECSDVEATVAAGRHRDSIWLIYGASAMSVFAAVSGAIGLWPGGHNAFWPVTEIVLISMIIIGFSLARRQQWHDKWIGWRFIAEQLRYAKMCRPLLVVPRPFMDPVWQVEEGTLHLASSELWFMQRALIMEGLPVAEKGTPYVASAEEIRGQLVEYVRRVAEDQKNYHRNTHHKLHTLHERMHKLEIGLFGATAVAVLAHFVIHASWLLICTAFFPALAAAMYGLTTKLEITRIEGQSTATERELANIVVAIGEVGNQPGWEGWVRLRNLALEASRIMSDENDQWMQLIRHQEAGLP